MINNYSPGSKSEAFQLGIFFILFYFNRLSFFIGVTFFVYFGGVWWMVNDGWWMVAGVLLFGSLIS